MLRLNFQNFAALSSFQPASLGLRTMATGQKLRRLISALTRDRSRFLLDDKLLETEKKLQIATNCQFLWSHPESLWIEYAIETAIR
ncbi:MAG: hypothetical protein BJG00_009920 [Limnothrix sp. CACIAM 69d]|nr:MAG: hypothetical protein BJG00_009920 [Limnothrix sp. CACIAM 69d]